MALSEVANNILQFLKKREIDDIPPSIREICRGANIKSTSTVHKYLKELEDAGAISTMSGCNRTIKLNRQQTGIPLVGTVAAGQPMLAVEDIIDYIPYGKSGEIDDLFALNVQGESMIEIGILDGDIVVVRRTPVCENGDVVVALVEDEATVKTFYKENGYFRLQPENNTMEPIIVKEVRILGRVITVIRHLQ